jgi:hypothetical protein
MLGAVKEIHNSRVTELFLSPLKTLTQVMVVILLRHQVRKINSPIHHVQLNLIR